MRLDVAARRVGWHGSPESFARIVTIAYRTARERNRPIDMREAFRRGEPHVDFVETLRLARTMLPESPAILVLGCGAGLGGSSCDPALATVGDAYGPTRMGILVGYDVPLSELLVEENHEPKTEGEVRILNHRFDLVVSHSFLHFLLEPRRIARILRRWLAPAGLYLMANEPNRRHWLNQECQSSIARLWGRNLINPVWKMLRKVVPGRRIPIESELNAILRRHYGLRRPVALRDVLRIVDPFLPSGPGSSLEVGGEGLDWERLFAESDPKLQPVSSRSCWHLGITEGDGLTPYWKGVKRQLARAFPLDGRSVTVLWRRVEL
ncbi:MAG: hypothetical protein ACK5AZ_11515 [Bryobacteraceae bacterium]